MAGPASSSTAPGTSSSTAQRIAAPTGRRCRRTRAIRTATSSFHHPERGGLPRWGGNRTKGKATCGAFPCAFYLTTGASGGEHRAAGRGRGLSAALSRTCGDFVSRVRGSFSFPSCRAQQATRGAQRSRACRARFLRTPWFVATRPARRRGALCLSCFTPRRRQR